MYPGWYATPLCITYFFMADVLFEERKFDLFSCDVFCFDFVISFVYLRLQDHLFLIYMRIRIKIVYYSHITMCFYCYICYSLTVYSFSLLFSFFIIMIQQNFIRQRHKANSIHTQRTACKSSHTQASNNIYSTDRLESRSGPHLSPKTMDPAVPNLSRHGAHVLDFLTSHNPEEGAPKSPLCS